MYFAVLSLCLAIASVRCNTLPPADIVDYAAIKASLQCRVGESLRSWLDIAHHLNRTMEKMGPSFPEVKPYFRAVHDQMKGSAEIISALPNITAMSKEAHYQLDHNCQSAPVGIQNFLELLKAKFLPFVDRYGPDLKVLADSANLITSKLKAC